ncbi:MAG: hypothetical protein HKN23_17010 [Verrucomicrobiales bacterium]|nr:hypothetical protein [Verrucomicrobiales bacterium]
MSLLQKIIRTRFATMSRKSADKLIRSEAEKTLAVGERLGPGLCGQSETVKQMVGVDEDMRAWNFYQILEHNIIVNRNVTCVVEFLAGDGPPPDAEFDIKHDVMPQDEVGPEAVAEFETSVKDHLKSIGQLSKLRGTEQIEHTIFGPLDGHQWHCLFGFHLQLHRRQAEALEKLFHSSSTVSSR